MNLLGYRIYKPIWLLSVASSYVMLTSSAVAQEQGDDATKELIRQWVATERLLGEEANQWKEQKTRMGELLKLHIMEIKLLNEELAKTGRSVAEIGKHKAELEAKVSDGVKMRAELRKFLLKLQPRVIALEKRFPKALKITVGDSIKVLETINDETSVRDILQAIANVLVQASSFNSSILQRSEAVTIGADTWNAEVIYLGLGRAYFYVGSKAGVGKAGADGWTWERNDEILGEVKKAVEVFNKQKQPQLVELPIQVKP